MVYTEGSLVRRKMDGRTAIATAAGIGNRTGSINLPDGTLCNSRHGFRINTYQTSAESRRHWMFS